MCRDPGFLCPHFAAYCLFAANIDGVETRERGETMELKVFRDTLSTMASLCETKAELPIETEILIPDYLPQVFKIVKCFVYLVTLQKQITAGRLTVEGYLRCVVYYQAEEDQSLCQTEQKIPFTRAMDLPESNYQGYTAQVSGEVEYLNCRAVNQRRVDVRGAYALSALVTAQSDQEIITALADCGVEQKMLPVTGVKSVANLDKLMTAEEELTLPSQPQAILDISGVGQVEEIKMISGKAVIKGKIKVELTYRSQPGYRLEGAAKDVPFNQIIDLDGVPDDGVCFAEVEMVGCTMMATAGQEAGNTLTVTAILHLRVYRPVECYVVGDAFSTQYKADVTYKTVNAEQLQEQLDKTVEADVAGALPDENAEIIGCFVSLHPPDWGPPEGGPTLGGRASAHVLCMNSLGEIDCYDKAFEYSLPGVYPGTAEQYRFECWPGVTAVNTQKNGMDMTAQVNIRVRGLLFRRIKETIVDSVTCDEALEVGEPDVALRIYYAAAGENVFDIAKFYHVSPTAMMKLNHLEDLELGAGARLLVPMTV